MVLDFPGDWTALASSFYLLLLALVSSSVSGKVGEE
jgi:hypothetical protein